MFYKIRCVENEEQLKAVLELCYSTLGKHLKDVDNYRYEDWKKRLEKDNELLLFAYESEKVVSAVLGRRENDESLVLGFVACDERYRGQGITKGLMARFEANAEKMGFRYITLGADDKATGFYEKCGYKIINEIHGQKIYQKVIEIPNEEAQAAMLEADRIANDPNVKGFTNTDNLFKEMLE